ncbi:MAG: hypothetical protein CSYNP_01093 [Syntrophus sp. SKADARSKE-3]|nr:hypothetical protein [Syntrophus sp. SKADARSKE-3]
MNASMVSCRRKGVSNHALKEVAFVLFAFFRSTGRLVRLSSFIAVLALIAGCHNASGVSTSLIQQKDNTFKRIAVLPFQNLNPDEAAKNATVMTVQASAIKTQNSPDSPERIIQDLFWERLAAQHKMDLVSPDRTGGIFEQEASASYKISLSEAIRKVGADLDADGVAIGYVYRFRERRGYEYSVEKPASVYFEIQLYRCSDGSMVWKGMFDKTQTSLMENMYSASYFVKDRGRWITARELASQGMEDTLKKFPGLQGTTD